MGYQSTHPEYSVRVDGIPLGSSRFVIQAAVTYRSRLATAGRERVRPKAQLEVVLAVLGEWDRGFRLGVHNVRIAVVGDRHLDRLFRTWPHEMPTSSEALGPKSRRGSLRRSRRSEDFSNHCRQES